MIDFFTNTHTIEYTWWGVGLFVLILRLLHTAIIGWFHFDEMYKCAPGVPNAYTLLDLQLEYSEAIGHATNVMTSSGYADLDDIDEMNELSRKNKKFKAEKMQILNEISDELWDKISNDPEYIEEMIQIQVEYEAEFEEEKKEGLHVFTRKTDMRKIYDEESYYEVEPMPEFNFKN
jgi:hypothetical protein